MDSYGTNSLFQARIIGSLLCRIGGAGSSFMSAGNIASSSTLIATMHNRCSITGAFGSSILRGLISRIGRATVQAASSPLWCVTVATSRCSGSSSDGFGFSGFGLFLFPTTFRQDGLQSGISGSLFCGIVPSGLGVIAVLTASSPLPCMATVPFLASSGPCFAELVLQG